MRLLETNRADKREQVVQLPASSWSTMIALQLFVQFYNIIAISHM